MKRLWKIYQHIKKDTTGLVKKINDDNEKLLKKVSELEERNQK